MNREDTISIPSLGLFERRYRPLHWLDVVELLAPVKTAAIQKIANHLVEPTPPQNAIPPTEMLEMLGNAPGLTAMLRNARLLCVMTYYVHSVNIDEAVIVAERMRRDAEHLKRAISSLSFPGSFVTKTKEKVHCPGEAAVAYFLMRKRLLCLYAKNRADLHDELIRYI